MESDDRDEFAKKMEALKTSFVASLPGRIEKIEQSVRLLRSGQTPENIKKEISRILRLSHKLSGSGGTFGFSNVSEKAAVIEERCKTLLQNGTVFETRHIDQLDGLVKTLGVSIQA